MATPNANRAASDLSSLQMTSPEHKSPATDMTYDLPRQFLEGSEDVKATKSKKFACDLVESRT